MLGDSPTGIEMACCCFMHFLVWAQRDMGRGASGSTPTFCGDGPLDWGRGGLTSPILLMSALDSQLKYMMVDQGPEMGDAKYRIQLPHLG